MKKLLFVIWLACFAATSSKADDPKALQGTWHCIAAIPGGVNAPPAEVLAIMKSMKLTFEGEKVKMSLAPTDSKDGDYTLDDSFSPKRITIKEQGRVQLRAVYSVSHDLLVLTFREGGDKYPTGFSVTADLEGGMLILQKGMPVEQKGDPKVGAAPRPSPSQLKGLNNMKQLAVAVHNYYTVYNKLPGNICDAKGKTLLSWRVAILPFLEQEALYKKFKLDEPWDSAHNKPLSEIIPVQYIFNASDQQSNTTPFQMFSGMGAILEPGKTVRFPDILDGTSNTFMFVEARNGVVWSKPEDMNFDASKPLPALGGRVDQQIAVAMCDGSVRLIPLSLDEATLKALITRNGGEVIDLPNTDERPRGRPESKSPARPEVKK